MSPITYTVDITWHDVEAIERFVGERIRQQAAQVSQESPEGRIARALGALVTDSVWDARIALEVDEPALTDDKLQLHHQLKEAWRRLVTVALCWQDDPGYQKDRWRYVTHTDATYKRTFRSTVLAAVQRSAQ
ncbi:hypothetical protein ACIOEW_40910 [Streptomyces sp. NPDC087901]|uniref:hypothetical protein n=1 Tax=Streptomyces sp. NPDC087901 TaxID=3365818 RepID=UPI00380DE381